MGEVSDLKVFARQEAAGRGARPWLAATLPPQEPAAAAAASQQASQPAGRAKPQKSTTVEDALYFMLEAASRRGSKGCLTLPRSCHEAGSQLL